jgi:hypothetical protein
MLNIRIALILTKFASFFGHVFFLLVKLKAVSSTGLKVTMQCGKALIIMPEVDDTVFRSPPLFRVPVFQLSSSRSRTGLRHASFWSVPLP